MRKRTQALIPRAAVAVRLRGHGERSDLAGYFPASLDRPFPGSIPGADEFYFSVMPRMLTRNNNDSQWEEF